MAKVQGRLGELAYSADSGSTYTAIGCVQNATLNMDTAMMDAWCRSDGKWMAFLPDKITMTIDATALWDQTDTQLNALKDDFLAQNLVYGRFRFQSDSGVADEWEFTAYVASFPLDTPSDAPGSINFSLQLTGALTEGTQA